jgi:mRNA-degrading endonuclease toxin of MazEF toxin-antitoxin module
VIVQDDSFDATDSITVCAFTTDETEAPLFRLPVEPNERNGLRAICRLMVDKITTVPKTKVGAHISRVGRRRYPAAQSGSAHVSWTGGLAKNQAGGVTSNGSRRSWRKTVFWRFCGNPEFVNTYEIWNQVVSRGMRLISSMGGSDAADFCFVAVAMPLFLTCNRTRAKKRNGKYWC